MESVACPHFLAETEDTSSLLAYEKGQGLIVLDRLYSRTLFFDSAKRFGEDGCRVVDGVSGRFTISGVYTLSLECPIHLAPYTSVDIQDGSDTKLSTCAHLTPRRSLDASMPSTTFPSLPPTAPPAHRIPRDTPRPSSISIDIVPLRARQRLTLSSALDPAPRMYTIQLTPPQLFPFPVQDACYAGALGRRGVVVAGRGAAEGNDDAKRQLRASASSVSMLPRPRDVGLPSKRSCDPPAPLSTAPPTSSGANSILRGDHAGLQRGVGRAYPLVLRSPQCRRPPLVLIASCGTMVVDFSARSTYTPRALSVASCASTFDLRLSISRYPASWMRSTETTIPHVPSKRFILIFRHYVSTTSFHVLQSAAYTSSSFSAHTPPSADFFGCITAIRRPPPFNTAGHDGSVFL
ncbi:hypothetical protein R3P38DRAFT_3179406 [Favolaschia claudopus]|uniref:Uncharacterized protein n=1 Tax=Favolaschia claudopus TaxID=2862362 RepID=A0AAW0CWC0_9AGAR